MSETPTSLETDASIKPETNMEKSQKLLNIFRSKINKEAKAEVVATTDQSVSAGTLRRFSSGCLELDLALGGGWPFGRIVMDVGNESTGKTWKALKACQSILNYDHVTHKHKSLVPTDQFTPCRALWLDAEGSFDISWSKLNGWDETWHCVAYPEYAEQAIDIVNMALRENLFDLIVVDSLAALIPSQELEESAEDFQVGLQARLLNKAMRKWVGSLNKLTQESSVGGACIYCLNQFRYKVGKAAMFGDPRTIPGGNAQRFAAAIIGYTESVKYDGTDDAPGSIAKLGGHFKKNKTFVPNKEYDISMNLMENSKGPKGYVDNLAPLVKRLQQYGLLVKDGSKNVFAGRSWPTIKALIAEMDVDKNLQGLAWRSVVFNHTGYK